MLTCARDGDQALAKERPSEFNTVLAVDRGETTLKEVATAISKALQGGEVKECSEEEYLAFTTAQAEPHEHSILLQVGAYAPKNYERFESVAGYCSIRAQTLNCARQDVRTFLAPQHTRAQ